MYLTLKTIHITFALISLLGFLLRALLMFLDSPLLQQRAVQVIPHLIDAVFLFSGFSLAFTLNFGLFSQLWLTMKIFLLMFYLLFVAVALNRGSTKKIRATAFVLALFTFTYIAGIAINKTPLSWFARL